MRTFFLVAMASAASITHKHHHHDVDLVDLESSPYSLPFHTSLPLSDAYKKSIKEAEDEANTLRKEYNDAQEKADEKQRL